MRKKNLTIKDFFYNSDLMCNNASDETKKFNYFMACLAHYVPLTLQVKGESDGTILVPMDFLMVNRTGTPDYFITQETDYVHAYSGDKVISPLLDEIAEDEDFWTDENKYRNYLAYLAGIVARRYMENWCRLYYATKEKYRPLDNVDGTDKTTYQDFTRESTNDGWNTVKEGSVSNSASNSVYGFNTDSLHPVPQSSSSGSTTPQNDVSTATPHKDKGGNTVLPSMNSNQQSIGENSNTNKEKTTGDIVNTRHGNIGVTKSTDLLTAEYDFRKNYNFWKHVFDDIDDVLTCHCYGGEC